MHEAQSRALRQASRSRSPFVHEDRGAAGARHAANRMHEAQSRTLRLASCGRSPFVHEDRGVARVRDPAKCMHEARSRALRLASCGRSPFVHEDRGVAGARHPVKRMHEARSHASLHSCCVIFGVLVKMACRSRAVLRRFPVRHVLHSARPRLGSGLLPSWYYSWYVLIG